MVYKTWPSIDVTMQRSDCTHQNYCSVFVFDVAVLLTQLLTLKDVATATLRAAVLLVVVQLLSVAAVHYL